MGVLQTSGRFRPDRSAGSDEPSAVGNTAQDAAGRLEPEACPTALWLTARPRRHQPTPVAANAASALASRLNWLRAGVLGANDGIVSVAGLVIGVAAATPTDTAAIVAAGVAGVLAGAVSMAAGEYVSVSTQSDTERAYVARQRAELDADPAAGVDSLAAHYRAKGLSDETARRVARELTVHDAVGAHLEVELGLREDDYTNPWHAAFSSAVAFVVGSVLPMAAILLLPVGIKIPLTFGAVLVGLALTGGVSARLGGAPIRPAVVRNVLGGALAMTVTWGIGHLIGVAV
ncbi:MAG: VIT family protein [Actinomyces ruminicola]|uniref:Predicted Fe2+/Mn2+ transporter, VIT1/CCC1 family n=1 Tax=Actinomyces ruminicola TaxID=332524 RepID=A0A1G9RYD9_9ACTO|nr:VIT family protein [Actinomyces ruminicola]MBE6482301.1 VIT family protein [Actinomyces ruminicola]SDM28233.1 Predicted Fe2+/Mn2+ transporter, VIT1/CCC1 family [Actinomyces ruminicola]